MKREISKAIMLPNPIPQHGKRRDNGERNWKMNNQRVESSKNVQPCVEK